ncbi:hypothetical protein Pcinc_002626 [Petrolisthes cinctipes]|uniref:Uncharacterized protein n=1 Tax=Petrolisthes cinctipes TaxID=88211 RepID=A0AAE1GKK5_PETCI|nr:hypothetical protein Pcinc_008892 [Petrolisthes cinctipes]KAK3893561.1 hypothetical protein Pcinc_002626 [Petrolisthes cinctipes]
MLRELVPLPSLCYRAKVDSSSMTPRDRLLEAEGLWKHSNTSVIVIGETAKAREVLLHQAFRNTVNALYFEITKLGSPMLSHKGHHHKLIVQGQPYYT